MNACFAVYVTVFNTFKAKLNLSHQRSLDFRESREAEPHPLWEYPCRALTQSAAVMTFDFTQCLPQKPISSQGSLPLTRYLFYLLFCAATMRPNSVDENERVQQE